ncbi:hypothetical protein [Tenacibaculum insulae]|uniref:hypothetical protein n=1 Tax=Tenacibaculum insulae TaxID=2029677 RepID=UPI003AB1B372
MKKVILAVAMVFATSGLVNANTNNYSELPPSKFDECDDFATFAGYYLELSYEEEHEWFTWCMEN